MNGGLKQWLPWIVAGVLALVLAVVLIANTNSGDVVAADTTSSTEATSSTTPETTTTMSPETTTTVPATTTTTAPPETTTTLPPETTTTSPAPGTVELTRVGVQAGSVWVPFSENDETTVAAVTAVLGEPSHDSGWIDALMSPYGVCPPPVVRGVHWNDLILLFTQAKTHFWSAGVPHFYAFTYTGADPLLFTPEGIGIGSSLEQLDAAYGGADLIIDEAWFDPSLGFWSYKAAPWTGLWGYATGQTFAHVVTSVNGGQGCGE